LTPEHSNLKEKRGRGNLIKRIRAYPFGDKVLKTLKNRKCGFEDTLKSAKQGNA